MLMPESVMFIELCSALFRLAGLWSVVKVDLFIK